MVARKRHPTDRRTIIIELTAKAEKMILETCPIFKDRVAALFSIFSSAEQNQLLKLLLRVREALVTKKILEESDFCGND
jgi:DNA-binding MarR family transcriptional regulator